MFTVPQRWPLLGLFLLSAGCAADPPAALRDGFVAMDDGTRLYYSAHGAGDTTAVIPVGMYLEEALAPLADGRRLIFYDPRNRGRSDAGPLERVSLDRQVADLETLREALGIRQMALIGWSGLGMEMAVYAMRHPDRVSRLVQIGAVPPSEALMREAGGDSRNDRMDRDAVNALDDAADRGEFDDRPAEYCRRRQALTLPANFADPAFVQKVPDVCAHENEWPANLFPYFGALLGSFAGYDWTGDLSTLTMPRLVIHGREDGIPLAGARAWAAGHGNARLMVVSPAGHFPFLEQPGTVLEAIDTFLDGEWPQAARSIP